MWKNKNYDQKILSNSKISNYCSRNLDSNMEISQFTNKDGDLYIDSINKNFHGENMNTMQNFDSSLKRMSSNTMKRCYNDTYNYGNKCFNTEMNENFKTNVKTRDDDNDMVFKYNCNVSAKRMFSGCNNGYNREEGINYDNMYRQQKKIIRTDESNAERGKDHLNFKTLECHRMESKDPSNNMEIKENNCILEGNILKPRNICSLYTSETIKKKIHNKEAINKNIEARTMDFSENRNSGEKEIYMAKKNSDQYRSRFSLDPNENYKKKKTYNISTDIVQKIEYESCQDDLRHHYNLYDNSNKKSNQSNTNMNPKTFFEDTHSIKSDKEILHHRKITNPKYFLSKEYNESIEYVLKKYSNMNYNFRLQKDRNYLYFRRFISLLDYETLIKNIFHRSIVRYYRAEIDTEKYFNYFISRFKLNFMPTTLISGYIYFCFFLKKINSLRICSNDFTMTFITCLVISAKFLEDSAIENDEIFNQWKINIAVFKSYEDHILKTLKYNLTLSKKFVYEVVMKDKLGINQIFNNNREESRNIYSQIRHKEFLSYI